MGSSNGKPTLSQEGLEQLCKTSGVTEEVVQETFDAFVNDNPNGVMKQEDFIRFLTEGIFRYL